MDKPLHMIGEQTETVNLTQFHGQGVKKWPFLLVVAGDNVAQRYPLQNAEIIIGRSPEATIVLDEEKVSRRHARITVTAQGFVIEDLQSTNKTFINSKKTDHGLLQDGDLIGIGTTVFKFTVQSAVDEAFHNEIVDSARYDELTGLMSRKFFRRQLQAELNRIRRYDGSVSLLMCDLDDFKHINDSYGHQAGDEVLIRVSKVIRSCLRKHLDIAGRYGGEEFVIMLPNTLLAAALIVAERLRQAVAEQVVEYERQGLRFTMSIGASGYCPARNTLDALLNDADKKLYAAKRAGKNQVVS